MTALLVRAATAGAQPISVVEELPDPTGLVVHDEDRELLVKSGTSGRVSRISILPDGQLGAVAAMPVTDGMGTAIQLGFDAAGNLYGVHAGEEVLKRVPRGSATEETAMFSLFQEFPTGALAVESPGLPTDRLFFAGEDELHSLRLLQFQAGESFSDATIGDLCGRVRHLAYRSTLSDLVASVGESGSDQFRNSVVRVSLVDGECSPISGGGFTSPSGIAWDPSNNTIFVADAATGGVVSLAQNGSRSPVATGLAAPSDLAFDQRTGTLFVADPSDDAVLAFHVAAPVAPRQPDRGGFTRPVGLAIDQETHHLLVKSGTSGRVSRIAILPDGSLGESMSVTDGMGAAVQLAFDAAGSFYGMHAGEEVLKRLPHGSVSEQIATFSLFQEAPTGALAVEGIGLPTERLFFAGDDELHSVRFNQFEPDESFSDATIGDLCGRVRYLAYRTSLADLVASVGESSSDAARNAVVRVSTVNAACSPISGAGGFVSPSGVAWDEARDVLYVADSGTGEVVKIDAAGNRSVLAAGLAAPSGLAFDDATGSLYVAEATADGISRFSSIAPTVSPAPTATRTVTSSPTPFATPFTVLTIGDKDGFGTGLAPGMVFCGDRVTTEATDPTGTDRNTMGSFTFDFMIPPELAACVVSARLAINTRDIEDGDLGLDMLHKPQPFNDRLTLDGVEIAGAFDTLDQDSLVPEAAANDGKSCPVKCGAGTPEEAECLSGTGISLFDVPDPTKLADGKLTVLFEADSLELFSIDYLELTLVGCPLPTATPNVTHTSASTATPEIEPTPTTTSPVVTPTIAPSRTDYIFALGSSNVENANCTAHRATDLGFSSVTLPLADLADDDPDARRMQARSLYVAPGLSDPDYEKLAAMTAPGGFIQRFVAGGGMAIINAAGMNPTLQNQVAPGGITYLPLPGSTDVSIQLPSHPTRGKL